MTCKSPLKYLEQGPEATSTAAEICRKHENQLLESVSGSGSGVAGVVDLRRRTDKVLALQMLS